MNSFSGIAGEGLPSINSQVIIQVPAEAESASKEARTVNGQLIGILSLDSGVKDKYDKVLLELFGINKKIFEESGGEKNLTPSRVKHLSSQNPRGIAEDSYEMSTADRGNRIGLSLLSNEGDQEIDDTNPTWGVDSDVSSRRSSISSISSISGDEESDDEGYEENSVFQLRTETVSLDDLRAPSEIAPPTLQDPTNSPSNEFDHLEVSEFPTNQGPLNPAGGSNGVAGSPSVDEINKIQANAARRGIDENASSQQILADMMKECRALGFDTFDPKAVLRGEDGGNGYEIEPYTMDSAPGKTFYQIKVNFELKAEAAGKGWDPQNFSFERTIYTTATNPEDAIRLAMEFNKTVIEYATKDETTFNEFDKIAMQSRSFTFNFSRNALGTMTHLNSLNAYSGSGMNQRKMERQEGSTRSVEKYFLNKQSNRIEKFEAGKTSHGSLVFDSKEIAEIYQRGYSVLDQDYNEISKKGKEKDYLQQLQQEIKNSEQKFEELAKGLINKPHTLKHFSQGKVEPSFNDEFKALASSLNQGGNGITPENEKKLSSFTDKIVLLNRINCELKAKKGQLEALQKGAEEKKAGVDAKEKGKAETFLKLLSPSIPILGKTLASYDVLMDKISEQLSGVKGRNISLDATANSDALDGEE